MTKRYSMMLFPINNSGEIIEKKEPLLQSKDVKKEKLTTINELVDLLKVNKMTILRAIEKYNCNSTVTVDIQHGKTTYLNERQVTEITNIIKSHHNLANREVDNVKTSISIKENFLKATQDFISMLNNEKEEYKKLCEEQKEHIQVLENKIEEDKKYVDFGKSIEDNKQDTIDFGEFAKTMNMGRNKLFKKCRELNILMENNVPYQQFLNSGYFKNTLIERNGYLLNKTLLTGKGVVWLSNKLGE